MADNQPDTTQEEMTPETTEAVETTEASETPEVTDETPQEPVEEEEITYHAVEKDGQVTALWEMQGRKHLRTIDPRSHQGQQILSLYSAENNESEAAEG